MTANGAGEPNVGDIEISPDGHLLAYGAIQADGKVNQFLTRFPSGSGQWLLAEGATRARFSRDGREVFYLSGTTDERGQPTGRLMSSSVRTEPTLAIGPPAVLFYDRPGDGPGIGGYDVAPDGRFLMWKPVAPGPGEGPRLVLVQNWIELMKH